MTNKDFKFWVDPDYDYTLSYENEKTLDRYFEIQREIQQEIKLGWSIKDVERLLEQKHAIMREQCDPQEVYCFEYNNYECCLSMNDSMPFALVREIFGDEAAMKITRVIMNQKCVCA